MEKKKVNVGVIISFIVLVLVILGLIGYILVDKDIIKLKKEEVKTEEKEKIEQVETEITSSDEETMKFISKAIFNYEKDTRTFDDLTDLEKINSLVYIYQIKYHGETVGLKKEKFQEIAKKYFDYEKDLNMVPLKDNKNHDYMIYDNEKGYMFNPDHPGHGGGDGNNIENMIFGFSKSRVNNKYTYIVTSMFNDGKPGTDTWCGYSSGKLYKSYEDAKNGKDVLLDGDEIYKFCYDSNGTGSCLTCEWEKMAFEVKAELTKYEFEFIKKNDTLVFVKYSKK